MNPINPTNAVEAANTMNFLSSLILPLALAYVLLFYAFTWRRPWLALLLIFALPPFQNDLSGGEGARFSIAEINLMLTLPLLLLRGRRLRMGPLTIPVFLYLFVCLISSTLSPRDTTLNSMLQMGLYLVVTVVVFASLARSERDFYPALRACVVVGILFSFLTFTGIYNTLGLNKNGVGASLASSLVVCCELWFGAHTLRAKNILGAALVVISAGLFFSLSRGAWLSAVTGIAVLCIMRRQFKLMVRAFGVMIPLVVVAWISLPQKTKDYAGGIDASHYNIKLRYNSLTYAQDEFESSPWLGVGVGLRKEYDATNVAMLTLAETGIFGLLAFALVHIVLLTTVWKTRKKMSTDDPLFPLLSLSAALIVGRLSHGMVDHYWSRGVITSAWASVGMATYAVYAVRQRQRAHSHAQLKNQRAIVTRRQREMRNVRLGFTPAPFSLAHLNGGAQNGVISSTRFAERSAPIMRSLPQINHIASDEINAEPLVLTIAPTAVGQTLPAATSNVENPHSKSINSESADSESNEPENNGSRAASVSDSVQYLGDETAPNRPSAPGNLPDTTDLAKVAQGENLQAAASLEKLAPNTEHENASAEEVERTNVENTKVESEENWL